VCHNGLTRWIANYLASVLWSTLDRLTHCQKFYADADAVQALELYAQRQRLRSTTFFVTFTMDDLSTVFPHPQILAALDHFLCTYAFDDEEFQRAQISVNTIVELVRLALESQYFVYENRLYRQVTGGASGSPLTLPLAYIYLYYCRPALLAALIVNQERELFGR
jgi:hypothetical protein